MEHAENFVGLNEQLHRAELTYILGVDPVRVEWCAAFVNAVLDLGRVPDLNALGHPHPLLARSFSTWGDPVLLEEIQRGDVVVFPRGSVLWQGHVGFYVQTVYMDGIEYLEILGGNQDQSVSRAYFATQRALSIRRWPTVAVPTDYSELRLFKKFFN